MLDDTKLYLLKNGMKTFRGWFMGICREKVTKRSDCFKWLCELIHRRITEFKFKDLPSKLKDRSMLHRAAASGLLVETNIDNNAVKTWKLNIHEIMKIDEGM